MPTNTLTPQTTNSHADQGRSAIDPDKIIWDDESINPDKVMWDEPIQAGGLRIDIEDNFQKSLAERNRSISESLPKSMGKAVVQGIAQFPKSVWSGVEAVGDITGLKPVEEFGRKHRKEVEKTEQYFEPQQEGWKRYITDAMRVISHMGSTAAVTGGAGLLPTISAGAGTQKYVQSREEGYDMPHSAAAGLTQAFLEYVTEKAPIGILKKPGMKFLDRLWKGLVTDVPGELMATVGEMKAVDEGILGKSYSAKEYVDAIKDTLAVASLTTTGMTAGAHGLHKGIPPPASPPAEDNKGYVRQRQSTHKGLQIKEPLEATIEEVAEAVKDDQKKGLAQTLPVIQQTSKEEALLPEQTKYDGKEFVAIPEANKPNVALSGTESNKIRGNIFDFGNIDENIAEAINHPPAPVRLEKGNHDYGEIHIEEKRGEKIKLAGYPDVKSFIRDVASGYNAIWQNPNGRLLLAKKNGGEKIAIVELQEHKDGNYYGVTTAFVGDEKYLKRGRRKLLWEGSEPASTSPGQLDPLANITPEDTQVDDAWRSGQSLPSDNTIPLQGQNFKGKEAKTDDALKNALTAENIFAKIRSTVAGNIKLDQAVFDHFDKREIFDINKKSSGIFSSKKGVSFDEVADALGISTDELADQIRISKTKKESIKQAEEQIKMYEEKRDLVPVGDLDLQTGTAFTIEGEKFTVQNRDEEGNLIIKDGIEYVVDEFGKIPEPDEGSIKQPKNRSSKTKADTGNYAEMKQPDRIGKYKIRKTPSGKYYYVDMGFARPEAETIEELKEIVKGLEPTEEQARPDKTKFSGPLQAKPLYQAYKNVSERKGWKSVPITDIQKESGMPMDQLKEQLLDESRKGNVVLEAGDWSLASPEERAGVVETKIGTMIQKNLLARFIKEPQQEISTDEILPEGLFKTKEDINTQILAAIEKKEALPGITKKQLIEYGKTQYVTLQTNNSISHMWQKLIASHANRIGYDIISGKTQSSQAVEKEKSKSSSKADIGGYADAKPPEAKTEPLEAPVIELPELVAVATEIGKGRYPVVKRRLRARGGEAIGQYSIPGGIQLRADIFKDPVKAQKTLAHEIGHWVDALPQLTHSRGNVLGNIASLVKYLKTTLQSTPRSPEDVLTTQERNKIRNQLIKDEIESSGKKFRDYITDKTLRNQINQQAKAKYKDAITQEIKDRRLITRDEIVGELKKVTQLWKPFDETADENYTKYRYSPEELYADALSVLINNPKILRDNAPVFYRAVHRYIVNKPEIRKIYKNMRALIKAGPEAIQEERDRRFDAMLDRTEKEYAKSLEKDSRPIKTRIKGFITTVKKEMVDRYSPLYDTIKNPAIKANVRNAVEDYLYRTSEGEAYFREVYDKAISKIQKAGIVEKDLAKYVYYLRVINERSDIANPEGHTSKTAQEGLDSLKRKLGDDKFNTMEDAMKRFWKVRKETVIARIKKANLYSEDLMKKIEDNAHYYTFDVEGYIAERYGRGESAKIFKQHGTLKGVLNPFTATLLKDMALLRAVNYKLAVKGSIDGLIQDGHYGSEIKEADTKITMLPGNKAMRTPREPSDHNFGLLTYMDEGKIKGYYVPKDVAVAFERNPIETWAVTRIMRAMSTPFREIFTRKRPGFWFFNIARDIPAAIKILPGASFHKFIPHLAKSVKSAAKGIHGYDATTQELLKGKGLIASVDRTGMTEEDTQFERMLVAHGLRSAKYDNVLSRGVNRLIAWLNFVGELSERTTKIAAYQYLKEQFPDMPREDIMHLVRWSGSPAFLVKGEASPITNSLLLFLNPAIQGNRIQYQTAKEHPLEYGIKSMKYTVLPKLLMFGAAAGLMGDDLKKLFAYIGSYDKINYTIIPLGWSENNKAVYLRIPQDEPGRILGGILWKTLTDLKSPKDALSVFDYTANQLPGINPALSIIGDTIYFFVAGKNPYDAFRGKFAVPEPIFKAKDHRSIVAFAKYLSNKSGLGVVYKFDTDNIDKIKSKLEEMLGYPVTSDIVGRFIKVSDSGLYESLMEPVEDLRTEKARESLDLSEAYINLINDKPFAEWNEKQKSALGREIAESPTQFKKKLQKFRNMKYGGTLLKTLMNARNNEERLAIIMKERELEAVGK